MGARVLVAIAYSAAIAAAQPQTIQVGAIDFFGTAGLDVAAIRTALPLKAGDTISETDFDRLKTDINIPYRMLGLALVVGVAAYRAFIAGSGLDVVAPLGGGMEN